MTASSHRTPTAKESCVHPGWTVAQSRCSALLIIAALTVGGCSAGAGGLDDSAPTDPKTSSSPRTPNSSPLGGAAAQSPTADAVIEPVPARQWRRMVAVGMWRRGCPSSRLELRRVEVNYVTFSGVIRRGVLVVNADVAASVARIFTRLLDARFPIRHMRPVEAYGGDSDASLRADNTSAYNCRRPSQINAPPMKSPHANGRAIDINPRENPWKDLRCKCWAPSAEHRERKPGPGVIVKGGVVWQALIDEGWIWQNIDVPDYMHFDTGYPSGPFTGQPGS